MTMRDGLLHSPARRPVAGALVLGAGLAWAYLPTLSALVRRWAGDSRYSHGYLVPAFAAVLLWLRRERLAAAGPGRPWWGCLLIAAGAGLRLAGTYLYVEWLDSISLLPCLAGIAVLTGGWGALRWSWPSIAFLAFMIPLPWRVESALGWPLQRLATEVSAFALQTLGLPAQAEGNIIAMDEHTIGVVEACSGLSMLILFFALATGVAMLTRRPMLDRALIVASAVPIALISNIARIVVTGVLTETVGERLANIVFHDLAGWLMMPLALALLGVELKLLSHLFVEVEERRSTPLRLPTAALAGGGGAARG